MKVQFAQSGGMVATIKSCEIDTDLLPPAEAALLTTLIDAAGLAESFEALSAEARDLKEYEIRIEGELPLRIVFDDANIPPRCRDLLGFLVRHARAGH